MAKKYFYLFGIFFIISAVYFLQAGSPVDLNILNGKFEPDRHSDFLKIPQSHATKPDLYLQKETWEAFYTMAQDAAKEGIHLYVLSATRNFWHQKSIWEAKYLGKRKVDGRDLTLAYPDGRSRALKILNYSSMPGTSRHHWGTDLDISFVHENDYSMLTNERYKSGEGLKVYNWMRKNAGRYGFCQPYQNDPAERWKGKYTLGYQEEKWHWSYFPIAKIYTQQYFDNRENLSPSGFAGSEFGKEFFLQYVMNVHSDCY